MSKNRWNNAPITDAIFVLNGGGRPEAQGKSNIFEWGDPDRYFTEIKLHNKKKAPSVLNYLTCRPKFNLTAFARKAIERENWKVGYAYQAVSFAERKFISMLNIQSIGYIFIRNFSNKINP